MHRLSLWIVLAIAVPVTIAVALVPVRDEMSSANLALIMVLGAVAVAAASNRVVAWVVCAGVTGLAYDFFLVRPYYSVTIAAPAEALTAILVLAVVVVVGTVSSLFRRQRSLTVRREENLGLLYQLVEQVATAAGEKTLIDTSERELTQLLGATACRYVPSPGHDNQDFPDDIAITAIGGLRLGDDEWDPSHGGLPERTLALPVQSGGLRFGKFRIEPGAEHVVARWELIVAVMIADLVGAALARWPADS